MTRQVPRLQSPAEVEIRKKSKEQGECEKVRTALRNLKSDAILGKRNCKDVSTMQGQHEQIDGRITMDAQGILIEATQGGNQR